MATAAAEDSLAIQPAFFAEHTADLRRWAVSALVVMLAHAAIVAATIKWREEAESAEPAAAIVIDFSPVPVAPSPQPTDVPPGPEQVMSEAVPLRPTETPQEQVAEEKLEKQPLDEPPPEVTPAPNPEVAVPPPAPTETQQVPPQQPRPFAPTTSMPQAVAQERASVPAAPMQGQPAPKSSALPSWTSKIAALLERNKRYPPAAQSRRQEGIAQVLFRLDRQGKVIASRVLSSSGAAALDAEALALLQRAQPFPPPPPELPGPYVELTVPIRFNLK
jgi:protein TonB